MSKTKIGLPAVHNNLKGKSYFGGPFSKIDQIALPEPRISKVNTTVVRDKSQSKERIFMQDTFDLPSKSIVMKTEPDSVLSRWTPSSKETLIITKRKIKQTEDSYGRASALSSIKEHLKGRKKKSDISPGIETYLSYLESNENQRTADFTQKMRKKSKNRDDARNQKHLLSSLLQEKISPLARASLLEIETKPEMIKLLTHSPSINLLTRETSTPTSLKKRTSTLNKSPLRCRSTIMPKMFYDFNKDEVIVLEISQAVAKNYKSYLETAARNGVTSAKVLKLIQKSGLNDIFNDRLFGNIPLNRRIYNDIFESNSDSSPISKSPTKKMDQARRINKTKLAMYKNVNQDLVQIITEFKVQDLKTLEGTLNQAHDNFVHKKKVFFKNFQSLDLEKYKNIKDNCAKVERILGWCDDYPLNSNEKTYRPEDSEIDSEAVILNRELDSIMSHWREKLYTQQY